MSLVYRISDDKAQNQPELLVEGFPGGGMALGTDLARYHHTKGTGAGFYSRGLSFLRPTGVPYWHGWSDKWAHFGGGHSAIALQEKRLCLLMT